ncbi:lipocalin family protein [Capnocytophaga gingivalis]|uniref:lipocalin family protein n=1 Tax=Capnocytophaga gingivalis TaxID=1017 RepID=UPI00288B0C2E|nr:lipocalin family protein [Capnocytophaga gingivalis]
MKRIYILSLLSLLLFACQKENSQGKENPEKPTPEKPQPTPIPPAPPTKEKTPEELLEGEWRLLSIKDSNDPLERELSNCKRQSSITFSKEYKASEVSYYLDKELGECKHNSHQYTVSIQKDQLTLTEGAQKETYTYQIKENILTLSFLLKQKDGKTITVTTTYKKDYLYNPKKELVGTWYIHHLKRAGYDYNDILENGQCMTKEKIIFTDTDIKIYQYDLGSLQCKEVIYQGAYEISEDLSKIIVTSKRNGFKGNREFFLSDGTLELFGYIANGDLEQKFYRKEKKYTDE